MTNAAVARRHVHLGGVRGPAGYSASTWTCVGAQVVGDAIELTTGQQATCTIVNTAVIPRLTLVKEVTNGWGGSALPVDWSLSAAGAVTIQGRVGDVAIAGAARAGGYVHVVRVRWAGRLLGVLVGVHGGRGD